MVISYNESATIRAWMASEGITNLGELESYWLARVHPIVVRYGRQMMVWNDMLANGAEIHPGACEKNGRVE